MKRFFQRLWFDLTYEVRCKWCGITVRYPIIPMPPVKLTRHRTLPRVSHGICPACMKRILNP